MVMTVGVTVAVLLSRRLGQGAGEFNMRVLMRRRAHVTTVDECPVGLAERARPLRWQPPIAYGLDNRLMSHSPGLQHGRDRNLSTG